MKSRFKQAEFESLISTIIDLLPKIKKQDSLLSIISTILDSETAILVRNLSCNSQDAEIIGVFPLEDRKWAIKNIHELRWWVDKMEPADHMGFSLEGELTVGQRSFSDSLVAFGNVLSQGLLPQYELILLQKMGTIYKYSTYHTAIAAIMLRHYEQIENLRYTKQIKREYAQLFSLDLLLECEWDEFVHKVAKEDTKRMQRPEFMGAAAILATAYNRWGRTKSYSIKNKSSPFIWVREKTPKRKWADYVRLISFLEDNYFLDQRIAKIAKMVGSIDENGYKAALVVLEHGWRTVREAASGASELPNTDQCKELLHLTSELCTSDLIKTNSYEESNTQIGRETLRLYLAILVCGADGLRSRYLWINSPKGDICRNVPKEVRREFLINISRFMLGVIEILEHRNKVVNIPKTVSNIEVLDGLLYIIDRFVHIELNVDERLKIRSTLGRGYFAEVHRHLSQHFYRDHLIHVIDVFLLGLLLLNTRLQLSGQNDQTLLDYITKLGSRYTDDETQQHRLPNQWMKDWAVASLFHDLSYQSVSFFDPIKDSDKSKFFFSLPRPSKVDWLNVCGSDRFTLNNKLDEMLRNFKDEKDQCWWLPMRDFEFNDHGILSALRLAQILANSECEDSLRINANSWPLINDYRNALHAIAHHNIFSCSVYFKTHPISCLLRLCDELQEWGRRRVNIEQIVKHLFLTIEDDFFQSATGHENLESLVANLEFELIHCNDRATVISRVKDGQNIFFWLNYRNPVKAQYDAITTFLSKAYNLQHVDLSISEAHTEGLQFGLILRFPCPEEYCGLRETDIYGLIREQERVLPEIWQFKSIHTAPAGLVWIDETDLGRKIDEADCIAIIVKGKVDNTRRGWQTCNPGILRDRLIDLKRQLLASHTLGPKWRWLIENDN